MYQRAIFTKRRAARFGRMRVFVSLACIMLAVGLAILPTLVGHSSYRNDLLAQLGKSWGVQIRAAGAEIGWLSNPALQQIEVHDPHGRMLATIARLEIGRSAWQLWRAPQNLGNVTLHRPVFHVAVGLDGKTNWETLLAPSSTDLADSPHLPDVATGDASQVVAGSELPAAQIEIVDGSLRVHHANGEEWAAVDIQVAADTSALDHGLLEMSAWGRVGTSGSESPPHYASEQIGSVAGGWLVQLVPTETGRQSCTWLCNQIPLRAGGSFLSRIQTQLSVDGFLQSEGSASWPAGNFTQQTGVSPPLLPVGLTSEGRIWVDQFVCRSPHLSGDALQLRRVEVPWRIRPEANNLRLEQLSLLSDVGNLQISGTLHTSGLNRGRLAGHSLRLQGNLDAARIAAVLPQSLRLREGISVNRGEIRLAASSQPKTRWDDWTIHFEAVDLQATRGAQQIHWETPIQGDCHAMLADGRFTLESLRCSASFGRFDAVTNSDGFDLQARCDLDRLAQDLVEVIDIDQWTPAGQMLASLQWQTTAAGEYRLVTDLRLTDFSVSEQGRLVWREPQLTIHGTSRGRNASTSWRPTQIEQAHIQLESGVDQLDIELLSPVDLQSSPSWPINLVSRGKVATWQDRLQLVAPTEPWDATGFVELTARLRAQSQHVAIEQAELAISDFVASSPRVEIREPRVAATTSGIWDRTTSQIHLSHGQFVSSTIACRTGAVDIDYRLGKIIGSAAVRADLGRIDSLWKAPNRSWRVTGGATGSFEFSQQEDHVDTVIEFRGENVAILGQPGPNQTPQQRASLLWQEPQLSGQVRGVYQPSTNSVTLHQLQLNSRAAQLAASGSLAPAGDNSQFEVQGNVAYDFAAVNALLATYLGDNLSFTGEETTRFELAGVVPSSVAGERPAEGQLAGVTTSRAAPHWSAAVSAKVVAPWQRGEFFGLPIGPGQLSTRLEEGRIVFDPLLASIGRGQFHLTPAVELTASPTIVLGKEEILHEVHLSDEVTERLLKFIAPALAGATRSEGEFSLQLEGARFPLGRRRDAHAIGRLIVHQVRVAPGPATQQWVSVAQQAEALLKNRSPQALAARQPPLLLAVQDQIVTFQLKDDRVYHENLEMLVGDIAVRTRGWVGLDESLGLVLEIPINESWVANERVLAPLAGRTIQVPVEGTMSRPRVDRSALTSLSGQFIRDAAQEIIGNEVNRALQRLFD